VALADKVLSLLNDKAQAKYELNFTKQYVNLKLGTSTTNFVALWPRKKFLLVETHTDRAEEIATKLRVAGVQVQQKGAWLRAKMFTETFSANEPLLREMLGAGVEYHAAQQ
jgi:hypothetical protein